MSAVPGAPSTPGADPGRLAAALSGVSGVLTGRVVRRGGQQQVRLRLESGADAEAVAEAVRARLAGLATEPEAEPETEPRTRSVIDLTDPGPSRAAGGAGVPLVVVEAPPGVPPHRSAVPEAPARLALARTRVGVSGWTAVAEVALADGDVLHVGAAEAASTTDGSRRALAAAAAQALESAGAGALRIEVDGVQVEPVAGRDAAVVALSVVSVRGAEQLIGCALVGDDPGRAVVAAVLAAANRRIELAMAERSASSAR